MAAGGVAHHDDPLCRSAELGGMVVCPANRRGNVVDMRGMRHCR